jgi:SEC-C motif
MGRNEPCWCRSGLKYKKCHLDRERQAPINIFEVENRLVAELRRGYCSYPDPASDPCSQTITKAHTIQKKGGISAIAEAGHVLTVKPTMKDMIESNGNPSPRKIGVNNASIFPGFCSKHDTTLFKPIEGKSLSLDKDTAFLFSYRSIAYERFAKEAQFKGIAAQREIDRGHSFWHQSLIQTRLSVFMDGVQLGRRDMDRWKSEFDERLLSGKGDDFHFLAVRFDSVLPIVASGVFHPEFDLQGNSLQRLGCVSVDLDHVALNVTAFEGQTIAVFGWIGRDDGPARAFADSFVVKIADDRKADVLARLLFIHTDNLFLRPTWWETLTAPRQASFKNLIKSGTPMQMRSAGEFVDDGTSLLTATVVETVSG